jgi:hypothetical protein
VKKTATVGLGGVLIAAVAAAAFVMLSDPALLLRDGAETAGFRFRQDRRADPGRRGARGVETPAQGGVAQGLAPEANVRVTQLVFGPYSPFPVEFRVMGPDPAQLYGISEKALDIMRARRRSNTLQIGFVRTFGIRESSARVAGRRSWR